MKVPGFLLRRLYVKGSLRNTSVGFEFQLCNRLGSGYARKMFPLMVDDQEVGMISTTFVVDGKWVEFDQVSEDMPFTLGMNKTITIHIQGWQLDSTPHKIGMRFQVAGLGDLGFDFIDIAGDGG